jgi:hypothetical protein
VRYQDTLRYDLTRPVRPIAVLMLVALSACGWIKSYARSHALYHPTGQEAADIAAFVTELGAAIERGDTSSLQGRLDPDGRKALIVFAANLAFEDSAKIKGYVELGAMAVVVAMGVEALAKSCPVDTLDLTRGLDWLLDRIRLAAAQDLGSLLPELGSRGGLDALAERFQRGTRPGALEERLRDVAGSARGCRYVEPTLSFRAWLLEHETWSHAEMSHTFRAWKERIERVHAAHLACDGQDALVILTSYGGPLQLADWHFFPSAQWPSVQARLDQLERGIKRGPQATDSDAATRAVIEDLRRGHADAGAADGG